MILINIIIGFAAMLYALWNSKKLIEIAEPTIYKRLWEISALFIVTLLSAFLYYEYTLITHMEGSISVMLINGVFLLGAILIALLTKLGYYSFNGLMTSQEKLEKAHEELKEVYSTRSNIFSNFSHEFRTPITIAKGAIELAIDDQSPEERRKFLMMGRSALLRLNQVVGDLTTVAKMGRGNLRLGKVDVQALLNDVVKVISPMAEKERVAIKTEVHGMPVVEGDYDALRKVVYSLLDNAIKFNKRDGVVEVIARVEGGNVRLTIADTGIGIPPEELDKIFWPLYQVDASPARKYPGTGMGLALVNGIVRAHNGRVWVESEVRRGSRFHFTLPIAGGV